MPYKDKEEDKHWHRLAMRARRAELKLKSTVVTPDVTPKPSSYIDADGNPVYD